jgi:hypothetical protein
VMVARHGCRGMGCGEPMAGRCGARRVGSDGRGAQWGRLRASRIDATMARCACGKSKLADGGQAVQACAGNGYPTKSYPIALSGASTCKGCTA